MRLSEGAEDLVATLKRFGYGVGVVSGGFDYFANHLKDRLGLDFAFANRLEIKGGALTGKLLGRIVNNAEKARIINRVSKREGVMLDQTVAIGDGANDVLMLSQAGLGIAYNAKRKLDRVANMSLGRARLMNILYVLGICADEMTCCDVLL